MIHSPTLEKIRREKIERLNAIIADATEAPRHRMAKLYLALIAFEDEVIANIVHDRNPAALADDGMRALAVALTTLVLNCVPDAARRAEHARSFGAFIGHRTAANLAECLRDGSMPLPITIDADGKEKPFDFRTHLSGQPG